MDVPTLDYSRFTSGTRDQRNEFAHALLESFERIGFVKLRGHPFSAQELKELFTLVGSCSTDLVVAKTLILLPGPQIL